MEQTCPGLVSMGNVANCEVAASRRNKREKSQMCGKMNTRSFSSLWTTYTGWNGALIIPSSLSVTYLDSSFTAAN